MFDSLRQFLDDLAHPIPAGLPAPPLRLAAAVLLMEVMRAEDGITPQERAAAAAALHSQFGIAEADMAPLLADAEHESRAAYDYFRFTDVLDQHLAQPQKIALIEAMWQVAYADLHLDVQENAVISKVADLLHVSHDDYIAAKMRGRSANGPLKRP
jgi:uncharacterized tellurite resistance protein B-like protein